MVAVSGDLLKQYTNLIPVVPSIQSLSYPVSKCTKEVAGLLEAGRAFSNPLSNALGDCQSQVQNILGNLNSLTGLTNPQLTTIDSGISTLTMASTQLTGFETHTNGLVNNLPQNMGTVMSCIRNRAALGNVLPVNPCTLLDEVMGTILGIGGQLLNNLVNALEPIVTALLGPIAALLLAISKALAPLTNAIAAIADQILKEVNALAKIFQEVTNVAFANSVANQANDPCLQAIYNAVGTPDLLSCLSSNIPGFKVF